MRNKLYLCFAIGFLFVSNACSSVYRLSEPRENKEELGILGFGIIIIDENGRALAPSQNSIEHGEVISVNPGKKDVTAKFTLGSTIHYLEADIDGESYRIAKRIYVVDPEDQLISDDQAQAIPGNYMYAFSDTSLNQDYILASVSLHRQISNKNEILNITFDKFESYTNAKLRRKSDVTFAGVFVIQFSKDEFSKAMERKNNDSSDYIHAKIFPAEDFLNKRKENNQDLKFAKRIYGKDKDFTNKNAEINFLKIMLRIHKSGYWKPILEKRLKAIES